MPLTSANTATALDALPVSNVAGGLQVTVELTFDGVSFDPLVLHTILNAQYGTVTLEDDAARDTGPFRFRIAA